MVIGGVIVAGEGVFLGAQFAQYPRGFPGTELVAAFKHHVLKGVGQAGFTRRLVAGADFVPKLRDHHGGAMVFAHYQFQTVIEGELVGVLRRRTGGERWQA